MDLTKLRRYAPQARQDFLQAVRDRAAYFGLTATKSQPVEVKGDVALIGGREFPSVAASQRKALEARVGEHGFDAVMEEMAYTWFNRLVALRYMELHRYLDHGYRVLSHPDGKPVPQIIEHAEHVELPGLKPAKVVELKLAGTKEQELYRQVLVAQCNALHEAMPFLFDRVDAESELLLPDNLLNSDSVVRKLVNEIDEGSWGQVEIIGWLYQFYIEERKDEVIGRVVAPDDIPAATQVFTPKWVVRYLVENSLGRQWLEANPGSPLRTELKYYVEPAVQSPEVQAQVAGLAAAGLSPEDLTLLDPACGSGHMLVEAYGLLKKTYLERGARPRDIPAQILGKNLVGLEIDERAAQLAAFALLMKAREDDRGIFGRGVRPRVLALRESKGLNPQDLADAINAPVESDLPPPGSEFEFMEEVRTPLFTRDKRGVQGDVAAGDLAALVGLFENARTVGSLIRVPPKLAAKLPAIAERAALVAARGDLITQPAGRAVASLARQAVLLADQYSAVVANPPYMGGKYFSGTLKDFVNKHYPEGKPDLYACFMLRNLEFCRPGGFVGMITIPNWMFLSTFADLREQVFSHATIDSFVHNGRGIWGSDFGSCSFVIRNSHLPKYHGTFRRLFEKQGSVASNEELEQRFFNVKSFLASPADFEKIPGEVVAYWISDAERQAFATSKKFSEVAQPRQGLATADDSRFLRFWHEVSIHRIGFGFALSDDAEKSHKKWFPLQKGGAFRRWYGNHEYLVNWDRNGAEIKDCRPRAVVRNEDYYFRPGVSWARVSISIPSFRSFPKGFIIADKGPAVYSDGQNLQTVAAFLNSVVVTNCLAILSPAVGFEIGQIRDLPFRDPGPRVIDIASTLVGIHREDWDAFETSWDFQRSPLLPDAGKGTTVEASFAGWEEACNTRVTQTQALEEENNWLFIDCFGLQGVLSPDVPDEQITLARPDRGEDIRRLVSYVVGCVMGRYSLDRPGLVYAGSGNAGFDPAHYKTFPADANGIVPMTGFDWFDSDMAHRLEEFAAAAWPRENLDANLEFIADALGPAEGEQPRETIRRYLAADLYKDHLKAYKRRPIYWLFSSGKERAFQALVYLHRYHEGTLSRMRTEYVVPLQGKMAARIESLNGDIPKASSSLLRKKLERERDLLLRQQAELAAFHDKLRHAADQRIKLDLDDGVVANYAKFGDLLADAGLKAKVGRYARSSDEGGEE
jgi:hypothetical protein